MRFTIPRSRFSCVEAIIEKWAEGEECVVLSRCFMRKNDSVCTDGRAFQSCAHLTDNYIYKKQVTTMKLILSNGHPDSDRFLPCTVIGVHGREKSVWFIEDPTWACHNSGHEAANFSVCRFVWEVHTPYVCSTSLLKKTG